MIILDGKVIDADVVITTKQTGDRLKGKVIAYDVGHGGLDSGAIAVSGAYEKDYNRKIGDRIISLLKSEGASVVETRSGDDSVSLDNRCVIANTIGASIFVSGHHNANTNANIRGVETYHYPSSVNGKRLAETIHKKVVAVAGIPDNLVRQANFQVLRDTYMPAALIEFGYLSNGLDEEVIKTGAFVERVAPAVVEGIIEYFS